MTRLPLRWTEQSAPTDLHPLLRALGEEYPIVEADAGEGTALSLVQGSDGVRVALEADSARIEYGETSHAARGLAALLAGRVKPGQPWSQKTCLKTLGIMLDVSRNAVMTVEHFQRWLRRLALMGYNMAMLYTEDTYELPGEPFFGFARGRYTRQELRAVDEYAHSLGIEMIACIQTLGHMAQALRWPAYAGIKDTESVMLVDEPATYALIDKMLDMWSDVFRSRRIHVGMDETHDLGRGKFLDKNGYENPYHIFNRHLGKVVQQCEARGLQPMIWSDMYFRLGNANHDYYDPKTTIPDEVKAAIPSQSRLVYWDYYHEDEAFYTDWIERHRQLGSEPIVGSGVWTWGSCYWYNRKKTEATAGPCIRACRKSNVRELFFTLWGDDGAYCEYDSALAGLAWAAELAWAENPDEPPADVAPMFQAICGAPYDAVLAAAETNEHTLPARILWDDPLLNIHYKGRNNELGGDFWPNTLSAYEALIRRLEPQRQTVEPIDFAHIHAVLSLLIAKVRLAMDLQAACAAKDPNRLREIRRRIPELVVLTDAAMESFRRQWLHRNKPQGLEVLQIRLAGLGQRFVELGRRIDEHLGGQPHRLDEVLEPASGEVGYWTYRHMAVGTTNF